MLLARPAQRPNGIHSLPQRRPFSNMQQQETATKEVMTARREAHQLRQDIPRGKNRVQYNINVGDVLEGFKVTAIEDVPDFAIRAFTLED